MHKVDKAGLDWQTVQVSCRRLDTLSEEAGLGNVGCIKLDVEGHELHVLRGSEQLVSKYSPDVLYEFNPELAANAGWTLAKMENELDRLGMVATKVLYEEGAVRDYPPLGEPKETLNIWCTTRARCGRARL
jgi:hypothetical protein